MTPEVLKALVEGVVEGITPEILELIRTRHATIEAKVAEQGRELEALAGLLREISLRADEQKSLPGVPGPTGPAGPAGRDGVDGAPGPAGERGEAGAVGQDGAAGAAGERGADGAPGPQGERGADGAPGDKGDPGPAGPQGDPGPAGEVGPAGPAGAAGARGEDGAAGAPGQKGADGTPGRDGVGLAGAVIDRDGALVVTLTDGSTKSLGLVVGTKGDPGRDGTNGRDGVGHDDVDERVEDGGRVLVREYKLAGQVVKTFRHTLATTIYRGVFRDGKSYEAGDAVTWAGHMWVATASTDLKPGAGEDAAKAWTMAVRRGDQGKTGNIGPAGPQGPRGGQGATGRSY